MITKKRDVVVQETMVMQWVKFADRVDGQFDVTTADLHAEGFCRYGSGAFIVQAKAIASMIKESNDTGNWPGSAVLRAACNKLQELATE